MTVRGVCAFTLCIQTHGEANTVADGNVEMSLMAAAHEAARGILHRRRL